MLDYAEHGELEASLAYTYIADAIGDVVGRLIGREAEWGVEPGDLAERADFVAEYRAPASSSPSPTRSRSTAPAPRTSPTSSTSSATGSTGSPRTRSARSPSTSTARTTTSPRTSSTGMAEIGGFGLSVPEEYGGFAAGGESDYLAMCVATEELSWGSLGAGGALITRPEILTRAIVKGGTEEQKHAWLPQIATGERVVGVMVTEPDFGSDVAGVKVTATPGRRRLPPSTA